MCLLNLFVGVISSSMDQATKRHDNEKLTQLQLLKLIQVLQLSKFSYHQYDVLFRALDINGNSEVDFSQCMYAIDAAGIAQDKLPTPSLFLKLFETADFEDRYQLNLCEFILFFELLRESIQTKVASVGAQAGNNVAAIDRKWMLRAYELQYTINYGADPKKDRAAMIRHITEVQEQEKAEAENHDVDLAGTRSPINKINENQTDTLGVCILTRKIERKKKEVRDLRSRLRDLELQLTRTTCDIEHAEAKFGELVSIKVGDEPACPTPLASEYHAKPAHTHRRVTKETNIPNKKLML